MVNPQKQRFEQWLLATAFAISTISGGLARAQTNAVDPTTKEVDWGTFAKLKENVRPQKVVFVRSLTKANKFIPINARTFNSYGLYVTDDARNLDLREKLNHELKLPSKTTALERLFIISGADMIVLAPPEPAQWTLYRRPNRVPLAPLRGPAAKTTSEVALYGWLQKVLGYNGFVLKIEKGLLVAIAPPPLLRQGAQAVLMIDSSSGPRQTAAIVELIAARDSLGIFKVLLTGGDESVLSKNASQAKLMIESK